MNLLFNETLYAKRRERARKKSSYFSHPFLNFAAESLCDRIQAFSREFSKIALIDEPTGLVEKHIRALNKSADIDIFPLPLPFTEDIFSFGTLYQLIILGPFLHSCNDVRGFIENCAKHLEKDGIIIGCFWGDESLSTVRKILVEAEMERGTTPRVHPMIEVKTLGQICHTAGLLRVVTDTERVFGEYDDVISLLNDLHILAESSVLLARHPGLVTPSWLYRLEQIFCERYPAGAIKIPFDLVSFFGSK